ncbi:cation:proton antiporter [Thermomicrobium sp. CFH 73360]|uniref:cation:proton antiporter n=1 Tax=Thermomicrobium sp. CFH 73360 TaxID=2951987 RepID=UPI00207703B0|nr:cation:proton antiporter [Thermomicrobium sp. CFH 73360]MCM8746543.1 cation:proton antiporter [Thermomicrobium sp. CFH 73360]
MTAIVEVLGELLVIFLAAKVGGELFLRLRQPAVIGEILAGIFIGPFALGLIGVPGQELLDFFHDDQAAAREGLSLVLESIAELGVIVLLFFVGLETRLADLLRVGIRSLLVAVLGVVGPFVGGTALMLALGYPSMESIFVGTVLVATSVGITARVLRDVGALDSREARIILGAAVFDDILGLLMLTIVSGIAVEGKLQVGHVLWITALALGFTAVVGGLGALAIRRFFPLIVDRLQIEHAPLVVALALMLTLASVASAIGLAPIVGAFLAGMALAEVAERYHLHEQALPIYAFLVPFFFVVTGARVDPRLFLQTETLWLALAVTGVAVFTKAAGAALGTIGFAPRSMAIVGFGMVPRGEVGLIIASIGLSLGVVERPLFSVAVVMSMLTTLFTPPILVWLLRPLIAQRQREFAGRVPAGE